MNSLNVKRILITGAPGFVGRHLYQYLKRFDDIEVFSMVSDRFSSEQIEGDKLYRDNINNNGEINYIVNSFSMCFPSGITIIRKILCY